VAGLILLSALAVRGEENSASDVSGQVRQNMRELWKSNVSSVEDSQDPAMQKAIGEVRSIDMTKKSKRPSEEPAAKPAPVPAPASQPVVALRRTISPAMLEELRKQAAQNPQHSLLTADGLFESGQLEAADVLYQSLLSAKPDDSAKEWLLLQSANCRRPRDPAAAREMYAQLFKKFPKGAWADVAQQEIRLIDWTSVNEPKAVLDAAEGRTSSTSRSGSSAASSAVGAKGPAASANSSSTRSATSAPATRGAAGGGE
jgi:tetratricopeptide (TPR) repeat protein